MPSRDLITKRRRYRLAWVLALLILAFAGGGLWLRGWAVVVDEPGQIQSAVILGHDDREYPLFELRSGYFITMVTHDGDLVAQCASGERSQSVYVSWLLDGELRNPCPPRR